MIARSLRDVTNLGFMHRERVRFACGRSELLDLTLEPRAGEGIIVDARPVPELRAVELRPGGAASIGAFAPLDALAARLPALAPPGADARNVRLRLALHDARVQVYGLGRTRNAPLEAVGLSAHELPLTIEVGALRPGLGIAERRRTTRDGEASHTVAVTAALRVSALARLENVRVYLDVDGEVRRATGVESGLEKQRWNRDLIPHAARLAAAAIPTVDARTSAVARSLQPLVLAALREAFEAAKNA